MKKMGNFFKQVIFTAAFTFAVVSVAMSQKPSVTASIDTNNVLIGDHVTFSFKFKFPSHAKITLPLFADTISKTIEVVSVAAPDTTKTMDKVMIELAQKVVITSFDSGVHVIPSFAFLYSLPGDTTKYVLKTNPMQLIVNTVKVDTTQAIKDIKAPYKAPFRIYLFLAFVGIVLLVAGLVVIIIFYLRKRRRKVPEIPVIKAPVIPAHELALQALEQLRNEKLWQSGYVKEYHTKLTDILKGYLEEKYHFNAMDLTTYEIMDAVRYRTSSREETELLQRILSLSDLVKFAKYNPLPLDHENNLSLSIEFVNLTKPTMQTVVTTSNQNNTQDDVTDTI
jgi:hypothetical protein